MPKSHTPPQTGSLVKWKFWIARRRILVRLALLVSGAFLNVPFLHAAGFWQAGTARTIITPTNAMWMAGFAARTNPADGKFMELWLKALALEDASGHRAVVVTTDLLGIPQNIYQHVSAALKTRFNLGPEQIILSASHTHCGPVLRNALYDIYPLDGKQRELIEIYSRNLESELITTVGCAIAALSPARLAWGEGQTAFAVNRRNNVESEVPKLITEGGLKGPVDHSVPVLAVFQPDGQLRAVLCSYACHNTSLSLNQWCGDYAGYAQIALEQSHPGAQAMFMMGCGGDQNALPRREFNLSERYGRLLAAAVEEVLLASPPPLLPALATKMEFVPLHLGPSPTEAELEKMQGEKDAIKRRWAGRLLEDTKAGKAFIREYPFPIQAWKLGGKQWLITLGGEAVVDYALKFKHAFGEGTWVAAYCNDVMTYIPSLRVLREDIPPLANARWGYEGSYAFLVYGLPAFRWADDVEDLITQAAQRLVRETR